MIHEIFLLDSGRNVVQFQPSLLKMYCHVVSSLHVLPWHSSHVVLLSGNFGPKSGYLTAKNEGRIRESLINLDSTTFYSQGHQQNKNVIS